MRLGYRLIEGYTAQELFGDAKAIETCELRQSMSAALNIAVASRCKTGWKAPISCYGALSVDECSVVKALPRPLLMRLSESACYR